MNYNKNLCIIHFNKIQKLRYLRVFGYKKYIFISKKNQNLKSENLKLNH